LGLSNDRRASAPGRPQEQPLRTTAIVLYSTLALLAFTVPSALVKWCNDFEPNTVQGVLLRTAKALQLLSHHVAVDRPYRYARKLFLQVTGKSED
jgi:hypothetical protein